MARKRILFVDDEPNALSGLQRILRGQRAEWDMTFVASAAEALRQMARAPFDVLITDITMAGMDGAQLLQKVSRDYPGTTRIVLSGDAGDEAGLKSMNLAHQYLGKPIDADSLKRAVARTCAAQEAVGNQRVRAIVSACGAPPSAPLLYTEVARAAEALDTGAKEIAKIIAQDMSMSSKLLQLVNSSFFGLGRRVSSIEQAVALLGIIRIKALVLSQQLFQQFAPPKHLATFCADQLWRHSLEVGEVARLISKEEKQGGDRPDQAFTSGVMHDIGRLIFVSREGRLFEEALSRARAAGIPLGQAEAEVLGVDHAGVGGYLLNLWGLPPRMVEAVALHHRPLELDYDGLCALTAVHVADALLREVSGTQAGEAGMLVPPTLDILYLQRIGLYDRLERWRQIAAQVRAQAVEVSA